jgi:uncharacterized protein (DUF952 family)
VIYHITTKPEWNAAQARGEVDAASRTGEGFIHCSRRHQLLKVAARFFPGQTGLVVLAIDEIALGAILVNEGPHGANDPFAMDVFPHVYGTIPVAAVVAWAHLVPDGQGGFLWPAALPHD